MSTVHCPLSKPSRKAFTLAEMLIAIAIFGTVSTMAVSIYVQSSRESNRANTQNRIYEGASHLLQQIAKEVHEGTIDYDEYYNKNVVIPTLNAGDAIPGASAIKNFGQNFGRYYSSFFYPGSDEALGFYCNNASPSGIYVNFAGDTNTSTKRNFRDCTPLRSTLDRNKGLNPFSGKFLNANVKENAFCGTVSYSIGLNSGKNKGLCTDVNTPNVLLSRIQDNLYLISADSTRKTVLAREKITKTTEPDAYALSMLRLKGMDKNDDGFIDYFFCADDFECGVASAFAGLSYPSTADLSESVNDAGADPWPFAKDFVPVSPLNINIKDLKFIISPSEDPHYAFAETAEQQQPLVTIVLTVEENSAATGVNNKIEPLTLTETVSTRMLTPIAAPRLVIPAN